MRLANNVSPSFIGRISTVDRAFDILELLAHKNAPISLSDVSRKLKIPKSSTHNLIYTLAARGYLQQAPDGWGFVLGLRAFDFMSSTAAESLLRRICSTQIQELAVKLGLIVQTGILRNGEAVIIDVAGDRRVRPPYARVGRHIDLHCTAQGKAIVAYLRRDDLDRLFSVCGLPRFTTKTICSYQGLVQHLAEVRLRGFATSDEEHMLGVREVAAPVRDRIGNAVASISAIGTTTEIPSWQLESLAEEVKSVATGISRSFADRTLSGQKLNQYCTESFSQAAGFGSRVSV